jgi:hypothetical protein
VPNQTIATPKGKRILLSILGVAGAAILSGAGMAIIDAHAGAPKAFESALYYPLTVFCFSLPGWLIGLSFVLTIEKIGRWRFWMYLAIGAGIGPSLMAAVGTFTWLTSTNFVGWAPEAKNLVWLGFAVSTLTTLIYLLLLRRCQQARFDGI